MSDSGSTTPIPNPFRPAADRVSGIPFMVGRRPRCVWEWGVTERTLAFLRGIDPAYFEHVGKINAPALETEKEKHYAALSIRTAYSHAVETFLGMLFAAIQAPQAMYGWILEYDASDIRWLVERMNYGGTLPSPYKPPPATWEEIAEMILQPWNWGDEESTAKVKAGFARTWRFFAHDFMDEAATDEYNSIKHGLRTKNGGFMMSWGLQDAPGQPAPAERMSPLYGSPFGTTYYKRERLDRLNFRARQLTRNWNPQAIVKALNLASVSIHNVVNFARISLGDREDVSCRYPTDEADYSAPWVTNSVVITGGNWDAKLTLADVRPLTEQEIRRRFQPATATPSAPQSPSPSP